MPFNTEDATNWSPDARDMALTRDLRAAEQAIASLRRAEKELRIASINRNDEEVNARNIINKLQPERRTIFLNAIHALAGLNGNMLLPEVEIDPIEIGDID